MVKAMRWIARRVCAPALGMILTVPSWGACRAEEKPAAAPRLRVVERTISLERGEWLYWQVDYRLENAGGAELVVAPKGLTARVEGFVSNSRVPGHGTPRRVAVEASGESGLNGLAVVLPAADEAQRCREHLVVQAWPDALGPAPPEPISKATARAVPAEEQNELRIAPGQVLHVRLRLEHEHPLYGPHDPLLGTRELDLKLGPACLRDRLALCDANPRAVRPRPLAAWPPAPPEDFLDRRVFLSPPESLHLEGSVPSKSTYRFPDCRGIRYGSRMCLSFWYLIAPGNDGQCQARITQYREVPGSWRTLYDGEVIEALDTVGRWVHVQRVFRVEPEATQLVVDFRVQGAEFAGDLWIDDIHLDPIGGIAAGP